MGRIFRALHTIKGSGAMYGFEALSRFTHEFETAFDLVRSGQMEAGQGFVNWHCGRGIRFWRYCTNIPGTGRQMRGRSRQSWENWAN